MDFFENLISEAAIPLEVHGFVKSGTKFFLRQENIGVIEIQKSQGNTSDAYKFTINLGIYSLKIAKTKLVRFDKVTRSPSSWACHWHQRIGFFFGDRHDYWWSIDLLTNKQDVIKDVIDKLINFAVPNIKERMADEALIDIWKRASPYIETIIKTSTLLKLTGRTDEIPNYLQTMMQIKKDRELELRIEELLQV